MRLPEHLAGSTFGQLIDANDLDGEVVLAAELKGQIDDGPGRSAQIVGIVLDRAGDMAVADMFVDAVGHQHESVALLDLEHQIVDFDLRIYAERTAEIGLLRR